MKPLLVAYYLSSSDVHGSSAEDMVRCVVQQDGGRMAPAICFNQSYLSVYGLVKLGDVSAEILDGVVQELEHVLGIVGKRTRILDGILIVVGSLQQARRPGVVANQALVGRIRLAILVRIDEEVGIGGCIVHDRRAALLGICLDGGIQRLAEAVDLGIDAFGHIAIAIPIGGVGRGTDLLQILGAGNVGVAALAGIDLDASADGLRGSRCTC